MESLERLSREKCSNLWAEDTIMCADVSDTHTFLFSGLNLDINHNKSHAVVQVNTERHIQTHTLS